jgi:hypothetical protein
MYEVNFLFVGGTGMNTTLPMEAINAIKDLFDAGKPATITSRNMTSVVYPQNLTMMQVSANPVDR